MFFANPSPVEKMRLNQFLKVEPPLDRELVDLEDRMERFNEVIETEKAFAVTQDESEEIQVIADSVASLPDTNRIERALTALMAFHNRHAVEDEPEIAIEEVVDDGRLNIFTKVSLGEPVKTLVGQSSLDGFSLPLVNRSMVKDKIELIERLMGRSASQANPMTAEIIKDMMLATDYPPAVDGVLLPSEEVVAIANELCDYVTSLKTKAQAED
jgi:intracellular multiplication protein IcmO